MLLEGYKGGSERYGTVGKEKTKLYVVQGSVWQNAFTKGLHSLLPM